MIKKRSYIENEKLARYACDIGDLDLAERCYKRAIADAEQLVGHIYDKIGCINDISYKVYFVWGRYDEAYKNFQDVLKYFQDIGDRQYQAGALNNMALIHETRGEYDQAHIIIY